MSSVREDLIWEPSMVIPYLRYLFYEKIPLVVEPIEMFLVGSRGRTPVSEWDILAGRDWDVLVVTPHKVNNTPIWGVKAGYHLELTCNVKSYIEKMRKNNYRGSGYGIELFPNTNDSIRQYLKQ